MKTQFSTVRREVEFGSPEFVEAHLSYRGLDAFLDRTPRAGDADQLLVAGAISP
ncbi:hypothetical protein AB0M47_32530 [Hamadaea sp. NPDC051192]|uniref:hypothetical protein n=1 Tax=Hamadaea sp. NPDC051192 TaxID=3154940 RepID=UPI003432A96A